MNPQTKEKYLATLKHPDTEEWLDLWFYRPVGFRCALVAERLGWHPNVITILSIVLGVACGICLYPDDLLVNMVGMLLLVLADVGDSADGQLARLTGKYSRLGRILDGAAGDLWFISIYFAIAFRLMPTWGVWIFVLGLAAGASHAVQCAMADYYRNIHLFFAKGKRGSELDDAAHVADDFRRLRWSDDPVYKFFLFFYRNYTRQQEAFSPAWQTLRRRQAEVWGDGAVPPAYAEAFRRGSRPLMPLANALTFNCRAITLTVALVVGQPWLYFAVEILVGGALLAYMVTRHERLCRRMAAEMEAYV